MSSNKYSVLLPTYEEAENLPLIVWLLIETFEAKFGGLPFISKIAYSACFFQHDHAILVLFAQYIVK